MLRVRQIKIEVLSDNSENLKKTIAKKLKTKVDQIKSFSIKKQSLDARNKNEIFYVYEADVIVNNEKEIVKKVHSSDVFISPKEEYVFPNKGNEVLANRPVIVGSGPAGLFAAYMLAEHGYQPLVIERGEKVEDRIKTVNLFGRQAS